MSDFFGQIWQIIVESNLLNILGAVLILCIGYLIALVLGRKSACWMESVFRRFIPQAAEKTSISIGSSARVFGRVVYGIIMLMAVLGCLSVLKMDAAAAPLQEFISKITAFMPNIAGALLLLFAAWAIAEFVKMFCMAFLETIKITDRLPLNKNEKPDSRKFTVYVSQSAGYIVYLFFLPAILNALKIYGITRPLQSMFEEFLVFIPNLIAATLILLVGLWAANLARKAARGLSIVSKVDGLSEKLDVKTTIPGGSLDAIIGWTVYALIALPVLIAALSALNIEVLSIAAAGFFRKVLDFSGEIAVAAAVVLAVACGGRFVSRIVERLANAWGIDRLTCDLCCKEQKNESVKLSAAAGKVVFAALWVLAAVAVCDILGLEKLASVIKRFAVFGGNIVLSCIVLLIGMKLANLAATMVSGKLEKSLVYAVKSSVIIFTVALAVSNLNLGGSIVEIAFALLLGAFAVACAIAFGIGGKAAAGKLLDDWLEKMKK